ncbi:MAG: hypothetical protein JSS11_13420 [Verrucomicrobia bacterium]|nr:hypothetical protein [Verrucomicrobiota bacterium]
MKSSLKSGFVLIAALGLLLAGCSTIDSRIKERSDSFTKLNKKQQQMVQNGYIAVGMPEDAVYMALDKPEKIIPGAGPGEDTWVYANFYSSDGRSIGMSAKVTPQASGSGMKGPSQTSAAGRGVQPSYQLSYDPAAEDIKAESTIKVHVIFKNSRVADIQVVNNGKGTK